MYTKLQTTETDHRVGGVEDVEEPAADGGGQDVVLVAVGARADPPEGQEHSKRRTHAEKVLHLSNNQSKKYCKF